MDPSYFQYHPAKKRRLDEPVDYPINSIEGRIGEIQSQELRTYSQNHQLETEGIQHGGFATKNVPPSNALSPYALPPTSKSAFLSQILNFPVSADHAEANDKQNEIVCFGLVPSIVGRCEKWSSSDLPSLFSVQLEGAERFTSLDGSTIQGRVLTEHWQMIQGLLEEQSLTLFVACTLDSETVQNKMGRSWTQLPCVLEITVYGPIELYDEIGSWFEDYEIYLQDPRVCHWDARYCNPHRLSSMDINSCPFVSQVVSQTSHLVNIQSIRDQSDLLDILNNHDDLEETPQPNGIRAILKRHQRQALTFMLQREAGWNFNKDQQDIWEVLHHDHGSFFVNRISGTYETEEPPHLRGGIVADPMGFGKTLTMIALVATDVGRNRSEFIPEVTEENKHFVPATLVVVPPPLLGTWEEQLSEHLSEGFLVYRRHHGKTRLTNLGDFDSLNIVLTTYHTVSAEWKGTEDSSTSILFSVRWRRIILDEAHFIRNGSSRMANAVCGLDSVSRWAVTGTPIQNQLSDLATLLRFIRAYPYTNPKQFEIDISRLWKLGEDEEAIKRLQYLSASLLLRRPRSTVSLPARQDMKCPVDFSREERAIYDDIRHKAIAKIDDAILSDSEASRSGVYVNVLQQIESMRLVCDLGLYYSTRHNNATKTQKLFDDWTYAAQQAFNFQQEIGRIICMQCSSTILVNETILDDTVDSPYKPHFSRCLRFICGDCIQKNNRVGHNIACGHQPSCLMAPVSISSTTLEETPSLITTHMKTIDMELPSKVKALVADIQALPPGVKCIVFSTWRLTLDVVERGLALTNIPNIRFDGKVPQKERQSIVDKFKRDPNIRVMLLTLSCGAVGLTLTEASRAYLLEPHWNPTLEEQALARIHRIGQTKEVTTVRFYIRDSFEERVMEIQKTKKHLASVLLSPHDGGQGDDSLGNLYKLRALI